MGLVGGGGVVFVFWWRGKRTRLFDERWRGLKVEAQARAFPVGLALILAAWVWADTSPRAPSAAVLLSAVYVAQILAAVAFLVRAVRRG